MSTMLYAMHPADGRAGVIGGLGADFRLRERKPTSGLQGLESTSGLQGLEPTSGLQGLEPDPWTGSLVDHRSRLGVLQSGSHDYLGCGSGRSRLGLVGL